MEANFHWEKNLPNRVSKRYWNSRFRLEMKKEFAKVRMFLCLSVYLFIYLFVCYVCLFVCLSVYLFVYVYLFICLFCYRLFLCLSVYLSVCLFVCLFVFWVSLCSPFVPYGYLCLSEAKVSELAIDSLLGRCKEVLSKYTEDDKLGGKCPLPR